MAVTLVSGFLGCGKTTLMKHILANRQGIRCAVIVNEISDINIDAFAFHPTISARPALSGPAPPSVGSKRTRGAASQKTPPPLLEREDKVIQMPNGCICCTLREDLLLQLRELATSGKFDSVLIESSGIAEPMQVAETFFMDLHDGHGPLNRIARLDNCVTVVDATTLKEYLSRVDAAKHIDPTVDASDQEGEKGIAQLLMDQIEFANVILLNKVDGLVKAREEAGETAAEKKKTKKMIPKRGRKISEGGESAAAECEPPAAVDELVAVLRQLNPRAIVLPTVHSRVDLRQILSTGNFSVHEAMGTKGWMEDLMTGVKHTPETLEYDMSSFTFRSSRAFHPQRLYDWMTQYFVLEQPREMTDEELAAAATKGSTTSTATTRAKEERRLQQLAAARGAARDKAYGVLFRGKGFVWLGSPLRWDVFGAWSQVGGVLAFGLGGTWDDFPTCEQGTATTRTSSPPKDQQPGQQLVFIGQRLNRAALETDLNKCLLTKEEDKRLRAIIGKASTDLTLLSTPLFPDPFTAWAEVADVTDDDEEEEED